MQVTALRTGNLRCHDRTQVKRADMHWTIGGADTIAALRCQQASRPEDQICTPHYNQTPAA